MSRTRFELDGNSLTIDQLLDIGYSLDKYEVGLTEQAWQCVKDGRAVVDEVILSGRIAYGINTGFGLFSNVVIAPDKLSELQENLIRSHACGVGNAISPERTRMVMTLRINVLAKGFSGIRSETLQTLLDMLNSNCLPYIPEQGTLGASGDLAPLSHVALGAISEGLMWEPPLLQKLSPAKEILATNNIVPVTLQAKEGLALINGTQFITALGAEAVWRASRLLISANIIAAITLEALRGTFLAFDEQIQAARPQKGQQIIAKRLRQLLHTKEFPSEIYLSHLTCKKVQDAYSLRCIPQVHGIVHDTVKFVKKIIQTELNCATDNPMVFSKTHQIISGGNFHAEYPAKALDYLAIGIQELSNISERRIERLNNHNLSELPDFLVSQGGLNSGFMIAHCTAAALTSENKGLCHPSSIDTISTSAAKEDHVSMGGWAARKAMMVVRNVETVLAIELMCATQGIDFLRPLKTTPALEEVFSLVREKVPKWEKDRYMKPDIDAALEIVKNESLLQAVRKHIPNFE